MQWKFFFSDLNRGVKQNQSATQNVISDWFYNDEIKKNPYALEQENVTETPYKRSTHFG